MIFCGMMGYFRTLGAPEGSSSPEPEFLGRLLSCPGGPGFGTKPNRPMNLRCGNLPPIEGGRYPEDTSVYHRVMADGSAGDVTAFVLAGGKSTRMGSDKAFLEFEDRTLLARALELAQSITPRVSIVGSREKFGKFAPVVEDIFPDCGPLAGIHAALLQFAN